MVVITQFLVYSLLSTRYGAVIFEDRYLIPTYFANILLLAYFVNHIDWTKQRTVVLLGLLAVSILYIDMVSDFSYMKKTIDMDKYQEIIDTVDSQKGEIVWYWGDNEVVMTRNLRALDTSKIYKAVGSDGGKIAHWGDYVYYDNAEDYTGPTVLLAEVGQDYIPDVILSQYEPIRTVDNIIIYASDRNPMDFTLGITSEDYSIDYPYNNGIGKESAEFGVDGKLYTNGSEATVLWTATGETKKGVYDFTLHYTCQTALTPTNVAEFQVGEKDVILESGQMDAGSNSITLHNVPIENAGDVLSYAVKEKYGTVLAIESIEIKKVSE